MRSSLGEQVTEASSGHLFLKVQKSQARFKKVRGPEGKDIGVGEFFLQLDIIALQQTVYMPISIASSKKPTGLIYQVEGTGAGGLSSASITCRGEGVSSVTLGTLRYAKIPTGKTAECRVVVEVKGTPGKEYRVTINRVNYKLSPNDARYKKLDTALGTTAIKFR